MDLKSFIGKENDDIEKELGFTHYIEVKDRMILGHEQEHSKVIDALLNFNSGNNLNVVKTDDGVVVDISSMPYSEIESNLRLLEHKKGLFWEEETEMCFALLGENFFSYVFPNMIMFSANEENTNKMAQLLKGQNLEYFEPKKIGRFNEGVDLEDKIRKLGRNEPCHCDSGLKYKKCCLEEDVKKYGHAIKI